MVEERKLDWRGKKLMKDIKRDFAEYLKTLDPKPIETWYENGVKVTRYEPR